MFSLFYGIFCLFICNLAIAEFVQGESSWYLTDTHIHAIPPDYAAAIQTAGGDPSGYATPSWSVQGTFDSLETTGSTKAVLSVSAPGIPIAGTGESARELCRKMNIYLANLVDEYPQQLDFFGALPDWRDVNGTLDEIDFLYSTQKTAVGVGMYTAYGDFLPGNPIFEPIWNRLEQYHALVFMHPAVMEVNPFFIGGFLPQPIVDYPQQTTRAAVDLVLSGVRSRTPSVDLILSHAGGTLPFLSQRVSGSLIVPEIASQSRVTAIEAESQFRRYYYDTALSASATQLNGLLEATDPSHVLFGTDYPYAPAIAIEAEFQEYLAFAETHPQLSPHVLSQNAETLIARHRLQEV